MENVFKFISESEEGIIISVRLVPGSSFSKIVDFTDDYVRIKISAPPVDNRANKELISFLSDLLDVNKSKINIISGEKSKLKKILIKDASLEKITKKIYL